MAAGVSHWSIFFAKNHRLQSRWVEKKTELQIRETLHTHRIRKKTKKKEETNVFNCSRCVLHSRREVVKKNPVKTRSDPIKPGGIKKNEQNNWVKGVWGKRRKPKRPKNKKTIFQNIFFSMAPGGGGGGAAAELIDFSDWLVGGEFHYGT